MINVKPDQEVKPLLKQFLANDPDHANASFQMALLYHRSIADADYLKNYDYSLQMLDTPLSLFRTAKTLVTEKEVNRNEEYYEAYRKRDLRTGKVDIQYVTVAGDLDEKAESLYRFRNEMVNSRKNFVKATTLYTRAVEIYKGITAKYQSDNDLILSGTDEDKARLAELKETFDSAQYHANEYRGGILKTPIPLYNQVFDYPEIADSRTEAQELPDFYAEKVPLYDFTEWTTRITKRMNEDLPRLRKRIENYGTALTDNLNKAAAEPVAFTPDPKIGNEIAAYDKQSLVNDLFRYQESKIQYLSGIYSFNADTSKANNDQEKLKHYRANSKSLAAADAALKALSSKATDYEMGKYAAFIGKLYQSNEGFRNYISQESALTGSARARYDSLGSALQQELKKWIYYNGFRIPLFTSKPGSTALRDNYYTTLAVLHDGEAIQYAAGCYTNVKGNKDGFLVKADTSGKVHWIKNFNYIAEGKSLVYNDYATGISTGTDTVDVLVYSAALGNPEKLAYHMMVDNTGYDLTKYKVNAALVPRVLRRYGSRAIFLQKGADPLAAPGDLTAEPLTVVTNDAGKEKVTKSTLTFTGNVKDVWQTSAGYFVLADFTQYQDAAGQPVNTTSANTQKPENILVAHLGPDMKVIKFIPFVSPDGLSAEKFEAGNNAIIIKGTRYYESDGKQAEEAFEISLSPDGLVLSNPLATE